MVADASAGLLLDGAPAVLRRSLAPPPRRILIHDYAGHSFQVQLSRWLAAQGHTVLHLYSADVETPRGRLQRGAGDPEGFAVEGVTTGRPLDKYALARRWMQERAYGARLARRAVDFRPDVVLSANAPPAVQARLLDSLRRAGVPLVCWVQDIFSIGAAELLKTKPRPLRWAALRLLRRIEYGTMRRSAGLIVISPDFQDILAAEGVRHPRTGVVENWAPLGEVHALAKDNPWSRRHGLHDVFVFLCSGTLGLKHNPAHIANLARAFRDDPQVRVVVVSQGLGRRWLEEVKGREGLDNLLLLDFQPFEALSQVLASADVSVVLLEPYAGALSVPSKVYSYFCAERPILGAVPAANLARRLIEGERGGLCVDPEDDAGFIAAARRLRGDPALRRDMAARLGAHAAEAFDMNRIGPRFVDILEAALAG